MTRGNSNPKRRRVRTAIRKAARKSCKWGGAVVTVLLLVVWIGSGWWYVGYGWPVRNEPKSAHVLLFGEGHFQYVRRTLPETVFKPSFTLGAFDERFYSGVGVQRVWKGDRVPGGIKLPIWWPFVGFLGVTSLIWRADVRAMRRARERLCAACGYDLVGLAGTAAGALCPECGREDTERALRTTTDASAPSGQSRS